tara:strand:+ start:13386 stop:14111 length:726 start_codon:yes stop_codon:yes gene_type:complete
MPKNIDTFKPKLNKDIGALHPITFTQLFLLNILEELGFELIHGPEIETEDFNFDRLNIKKTHPARQMHDTFYVNNESHVLRTHTSPVQIRGMLERRPPTAFISAGKVYRKDDDATHLPMFHQIEGIIVDKNISFSNLKDLMFDILSKIFGDDISLRFRPSYFPFTEPSAEVDILSDENKWLEILGCGIVNPVVLENCKIDSKEFSGLAFGLGVERIAMLKFGISDIREFYKSNLDFLKQIK